MRSQVSVTFKNTAPFCIEISPEQVLDREIARKWLDEIGRAHV